MRAHTRLALLSGLSSEMRSELSGGVRYSYVYHRVSPTFERCCASQLFGGARLCCWAPDAVKSRIVFIPNEWMNPRSKCTSFSNLALCSTRSLWRENFRQRWVGWHLDEKRALSLRPSSSRTLILASDSSCTPYGGGIRRGILKWNLTSTYRANSSALLRVFLFEEFVLRFDELKVRSAKETSPLSHSYVPPWPCSTCPDFPCIVLSACQLPREGRQAEF